jgi:hypothetical protein
MRWYERYADWAFELSIRALVAILVGLAIGLVLAHVALWSLFR